MIELCAKPHVSWEIHYARAQYPISMSMVSFNSTVSSSGPDCVYGLILLHILIKLQT